MNRKKGFTLIEIIAVVLLLALITIIIVPKAKKTLEAKKNQMYASVINTIEESAKNFAYLNIDVIDNVIETNGEYYVSILQLKEQKLLQNDLVNPKTNEDFPSDGNVKITKVADKYEFEYIAMNLQTLTLDLDGGSISLDPAGSYLTGQMVQLLSPVKSGYTFGGWAIVTAGSSTISGNVLTIGAENVTVKANWILNVELIVNLNSGSISLDPAGTYHPNDIVSLATPTRAGYVFTGWTIVSGNSVLSGNTLTIGSTNTTIKANWENAIITVTYNCNGGSGSISSLQHTIGQLGTFASTGCTKAMSSSMIYYLKGWATSSNATTPTYLAGASIPITLMNNLTLYAVYDDLISITGNYQFINDGSGNWRIKIKGSLGNTSGNATLTIQKSMNIDIFVVGGGATNYSGIAATYRNINISAGAHSIVIGSGTSGSTGGTSYFGSSSTYYAPGGGTSMEGIILSGSGKGLAGGCRETCPDFDCYYPNTVCTGGSRGGSYGNYGLGLVETNCVESCPDFDCYWPNYSCEYTNGGAPGQLSFSATTFPAWGGKTTCEFNQGTPDGCNSGVDAYSPGAGGAANGSGITGSLGDGLSGNNSGAPTKSGIVIIRNHRI